MALSLSRKLHISAMAGAGSLLLVVPTIFFGQVLAEYHSNTLFALYAFLTLLLIALSLVMLYGFVFMGRTLKKPHLIRSSFVLMAVFVFLFIPEMLLIYFASFASMKMLFYIPIVVCYGVVIIYFGVSSFSLRTCFGNLAVVMSVCAIISGILYTSVVLLVFAMPFLFAACVLSAIMLFRAPRICKM